ncbi:MAG: hypothetical protein V1659_04210 [Candidatus Woesearchaeota archaeon]
MVKMASWHKVKGNQPIKFGGVSDSAGVVKLKIPPGIYAASLVRDNKHRPLRVLRIKNRDTRMIDIPADATETVRVPFVVESFGCTTMMVPPGSKIPGSTFDIYAILPNSSDMNVGTKYSDYNIVLIPHDGTEADSMNAQVGDVNELYKENLRVIADFRDLPRVVDPRGYDNWRALSGFLGGALGLGKHRAIAKRFRLPHDCKPGEYDIMVRLNQVDKFGTGWVVGGMVKVVNKPDIKWKINLRFVNGAPFNDDKITLQNDPNNPITLVADLQNENDERISDYSFLTNNNYCIRVIDEQGSTTVSSQQASSNPANQGKSVKILTFEKTGSTHFQIKPRSDFSSTKLRLTLVKRVFEGFPQQFRFEEVPNVAEKVLEVEFGVVVSEPVPVMQDRGMNGKKVPTSVYQSVVSDSTGKKIGDFSISALVNNGTFVENIKGYHSPPGSRIVIDENNKNAAVVFSNSNGILMFPIRANDSKTEKATLTLTAQGIKPITADIQFLYDEPKPKKETGTEGSHEAPPAPMPPGASPPAAVPAQPPQQAQQSVRLDPGGLTQTKWKIDFVFKKGKSEVSSEKGKGIPYSVHAQKGMKYLAICNFQVYELNNTGSRKQRIEDPSLIKLEPLEFRSYQKKMYWRLIEDEVKTEIKVTITSKLPAGAYLVECRSQIRMPSETGAIGVLNSRLTTTTLFVEKQGIGVKYVAKLGDKTFDQFEHELEHIDKLIKIQIPDTTGVKWLEDNTVKMLQTQILQPLQKLGEAEGIIRLFGEGFFKPDEHKENFRKVYAHAMSILIPIIKAHGESLSVQEHQKLITDISGIDTNELKRRLEFLYHMIKMAEDYEKERLEEDIRRNGVVM